MRGMCYPVWLIAAQYIGLFYICDLTYLGRLMFCLIFCIGHTKVTFLEAAELVL